MLEHLRVTGTASDRKLRLFACACCRAVWPDLTTGSSRAAVEVAERYADGLAVERDLHRAQSMAIQAARRVVLAEWPEQPPPPLRLRRLGYPAEAAHNHRP